MTVSRPSLLTVLLLPPTTFFLFLAAIGSTTLSSKHPSLAHALSQSQSPSQSQSQSPSPSQSLDSLYAEARRVRALEGQTPTTSTTSTSTSTSTPASRASEDLYRSILERNPADATAATRIAADPDAADKHDRLGRGGTLRERAEAVRFLRESFGFSGEAVARFVFDSNDEEKDKDNDNSKDNTAGADNDRLDRARNSSAPLYLRALRAGTRPPPLPTSPLGACVQLFLLAVCLPTETCVELMGGEFVRLAETLGLAFRTATATATATSNDSDGDSDGDDWFVPYAHVFPVAIGEETLYFATDLHPNVLSRTNVGGKPEDGNSDSESDSDGTNPDHDHGAVMYIGPDSLALVDHWSSLERVTEHDTILDVGCGSGIQALGLVAKAKASSEKKATATAATTTQTPRVTCVDINRRALRLTKLNFEWNGFEAPTLIHGNINAPVGRILSENSHGSSSSSSSPSSPLLPQERASADQPWTELLKASSVTHLVSNPPFLPVPVSDPSISARYGLFSSGGSTGEEFFESLVRLARRVLDEKDPSATLAVVSEFMNPGPEFGRRLSVWWGGSESESDDGESNGNGNGNTNGSARALLLTNENPLDAAEYSQRRANDAREAVQWYQHLGTNGIRFVSPGLLFLRRNHRSPSARSTTRREEEDEEEDPGLVDRNTGGAVDLTHVVVPKTEEGSIWTPTNSAGRDFTRHHVEEFKSV